MQSSEVQNEKNEKNKIMSELEKKYVINFEGATISQGKEILTDVNLTIEEGEFLYIIGKTGTGKSSLLKTIYAEIPLKIGAAEVCGFKLNDIKKKNIPLLRRKLGIIFQDFQLMQDRNVFDNIAFVLKAVGVKDKNEIEQRVVQTLSDVGLADKGNEKTYNLSEGEMQRVVVARAIVNNPEVIIADEPTGNLDPITSEEIVKLLLKINQERKTTVIMATHDYIVIEKFRQRVICCENGKVIS